MNINKDSVVVNVQKHSVTVTNSNVVHIHHLKTCLKPCDKVEAILEYLEDELFVVEGYAVTGE